MKTVQIQLTYTFLPSVAPVNYSGRMTELFDLSDLPEPHGYHDHDGEQVLVYGSAVSAAGEDDDGGTEPHQPGGRGGTPPYGGTWLRNLGNPVDGHPAQFFQQKGLLPGPLLQWEA